MLLSSPIESERERERRINDDDQLLLMRKVDYIGASQHENAYFFVFIIFIDAMDQ